MDKNRYNNFDIVRLLAALQVLQEHTAFWLNLPRPNWFVYLMGLFPGVPIFFIISGFLITTSYLFGANGTLSFFARRGLRIYPALWVNVGLILIMLTVTGSLSGDLPAGKFITWILVAYSSGADIYANFVAGSIVNPKGFYPFFPSLVLWTLPVELGFYLLVPIILLFRRGPEWVRSTSLFLWMLLSLCLMFSFGRLKLENPDGLITKILSVTTLTYLWYFLIGGIVAAYWKKLSWLFIDRFPFWLLLHLSISGLDKWLYGHGSIDFHDITAMLPIHVVTLAATVISFAFSWRNWGRALGGVDLSYGTYLYHVPVVLSLKFSGLALGFVGWPLVTGTTLVLAAGSWFAIEKPMLRLKLFTDRWLAPHKAYSRC